MQDIIQTGLSRRDRQNREKLAEELVHLLTCEGPPIIFPHDLDHLDLIGLCNLLTLSSEWTIFSLGN